MSYESMTSSGEWEDVEKPVVTVFGQAGLKVGMIDDIDRD